MESPCRDCNGMRQDSISRGFSKTVRVKLKEYVLKNRCIIFLEYRDSLSLTNERKAIDYNGEGYSLIL